MYSLHIHVISVPNGWYGTLECYAEDVGQPRIQTVSASCDMAVWECKAHDEEGQMLEVARRLSR